MHVMTGKHLRLIGALDTGLAGWYISPNGYDLYRTGAGDSLVVLAARYLGSASRAGEIWALQSSGWRSARGDDINNVEKGATLFMPQEAIDKAKALGQIEEGGRGAAPTKAATGKVLAGGTDVLKGSTSVVPAPVPVRPSTPATVTPTVTPTTSTTTLSTTAKVALVAAGVVVAGGAVAYGVHKFKGSRARGSRGKFRNTRGIDGWWP